MKILYSQIKELLPNLKADAREVGEVLSMIGFLMDGLNDMNYQGTKDQIISLEVRQNRADCFSVIGLAREVAAYYGLAVKMPKQKSLSLGKKKLNIKVDAKKYVKRILAVQIEGLKNKPSPDWLKEFLTFYKVNSINVLVDISNYIMLYTGYPPHILDKGKMIGDARWMMNKNFKEIVTLDGSAIELNDKVMLICDDKNPLSTMMVGGQAATVDLNTESIIGEIAVYDGKIVSRNARFLKISTEAGSRLEKIIDPNGVDYAMNMMINMILENCGGKIASKFFDYYPKKREINPIEFDLKEPKAYSGADIRNDQVLKILKNLRFKVASCKGSKLMVIPPSDRMDIELMEDVVEEIVRMYGYRNISSEETPKLVRVENITPKIIALSEKIRDIMSISGFDEVLSQPLVEDGMNQKTNYLPWEEVVTQNAVNDEYPNLRQSIATGLLRQKENYLKKNLELINIFEIGVVFGKKANEYQEHDSLGALLHISTEKAKNGLPKINLLQASLEKLLRHLGFVNIDYKLAKSAPEIANPHSCWDIFANSRIIGIIYKMKLEESGKIYFFEINLLSISEMIDKLNNNSAVEIKKKLIALDANVELGVDKSILKFIDQVKNNIASENVFSFYIKDVFPLKGEKKIRYTIHAVYSGLSDQEAKKIHLKLFNLN